MHPSDGVSKTPVDTTMLRRALGSFVTGVTVVTTRGANGEPIGLTVNSFNAVSLNPPLVLWSLSLHAASFDLSQWICTGTVQFQRNAIGITSSAATGI